MLRSHLGTLLLLSVLLPLSSRAQASKPGPEQATPPPLITAPEQPAPEDPPTTEAPAGSTVPEGELIPREHTPGAKKDGRVFYQLAGGTGATLGAMLLGYGILALDPQNCGGFFCNVDYLVYGVGVGGLAVLAATPTVVWLIGKRYDDRGRFFPTLAGTALGIGAAVLSVATFHESVSREGNVMLCIFWPSVITMIVHEYTRAPAPTVSASAGPRVLPVLSMSRHGGIVGGLMGAF
ncbi:MAG TPA: hypothetical protein VK539_15785 [Myxococcaceae bacterium]|nr:hypothetical protein [Myxococcaceae bacterium]